MMRGDDDEENRCYWPPEGPKTWEEAVPRDKTFTVELNVQFRGVEITSTEQLRYKLDSFFGTDVCFKDIKVSKPRAYVLHQVVMDTENLMLLVKHDNYGKFENDYTIEVVSYRINKSTEGLVEDCVDSPMRLCEKVRARDGDEKELEIVMRRGPNPSDPPAKGMQTFRLLSELSEVTKILQHFNLVGKVTRVSRATPSIPTLAIEMTDTVEIWQDLINEEPMLVYKPTQQSMDSGRVSELWAHLRLDKNQRSKRVTIEGIVGRASLEEVKHKLSYHGEIKSEMTPVIWTSEDTEEMKNVKNGDLAVTIDLIYEINYLVIGRADFRVTYQGQKYQCSVCYSWDHSTKECWRKDERRDDLKWNYNERWKRAVKYKKEDWMVLKHAGLETATGETGGGEGAGGRAEERGGEERVAGVENGGGRSEVAGMLENGDEGEEEREGDREGEDGSEDGGEISEEAGKKKNEGEGTGGEELEDGEGEDGSTGEEDLGVEDREEPAVGDTEDIDKEEMKEREQEDKEEKKEGEEKEKGGEEVMGVEEDENAKEEAKMKKEEECDNETEDNEGKKGDDEEDEGGEEGKEKEEDEKAEEVAKAKITVAAATTAKQSTTTGITTTTEGTRSKATLLPAVTKKAKETKDESEAKLAKAKMKEEPKKGKDDATATAKRKAESPKSNNSKVTGSGKKKNTSMEKDYQNFKKELEKLELRFKKENGKEKAKTKKEVEELLEKTKNKIQAEDGGEETKDDLWKKCLNEIARTPWKGLTKQPL